MGSSGGTLGSAVGPAGAHVVPWGFSGASGTPEARLHVCGNGGRDSRGIPESDEATGKASEQMGTEEGSFGDAGEASKSAVG
eukprot:6456947-Pyramimonas_sp.AAC.1